MVPMSTQIQMPTRRDNIAELRKRDGDICGMPFCDKQLDFTITDQDSPWLVTIDHWMPQWWCREQDWSEDKIWELSNLRLAHKTCNAKKGERIPNEDGTIPDRIVKKVFRYRREKRAQRPELCTQCYAGNYLAADEVCAACGMTGKAMPQWAKVKYNECDHELLWCWVCSITPDMRTPAVDVAVLQSESGEWDAE